MYVGGEEHMWDFNRVFERSTGHVDDQQGMWGINRIFEIELDESMPKQFKIGCRVYC